MFVAIYAGTTTVTAYHDRNKEFVQQSLSSCSHAFVKVDKVRRPDEPCRYFEDWLKAQVLVVFWTVK